MIGASLEATLIVALTFGLIAGSAFAAKGGGKGPGKPGGGDSSSTLSVRMVVDTNGDGALNWNEQITFDVATSATDQPHVQLTCSQHGAVVYSASAGFYDGYPWPWNQVFELSSRAWAGGAADCVAVLSYWDGRRFRDLASLSLSVQS